MLSLSSFHREERHISFPPCLPLRISRFRRCGGENRDGVGITPSMCAFPGFPLFVRHKIGREGGDLPLSGDIGGGAFYDERIHMAVEFDSLLVAFEGTEKHIVL